MPKVLKKGDGVRLLVSYQEHIAGEGVCFFSNLDSVTTYSVSGDATDLMTIDLAKSLRRDGIAIENPKCLLLECRDGFANLPLIAHCGEHLEEDVNRTMDGVRHFFEGLNNKGNEQSLSLGLTWNIDEDRSVVVSFMGAVPDLLEWMKSFITIPVERGDFRHWLEQQVKFIHGHGRDDESPINASYIQSDGTFFQKRRNIQEDVDLKDVKLEGDGFMAQMELLPGKEHLKSYIDAGELNYTPMVVVGDIVCEKTGTDYLTSPLIAPFGETVSAISKMESMVFVWCGQSKTS